MMMTDRLRGDRPLTWDAEARRFRLVRVIGGWSLLALTVVGLAVVGGLAMVASEGERPPASPKAPAMTEAAALPARTLPPSAQPLLFRGVAPASAAARRACLALGILDPKKDCRLHEAALNSLREAPLAYNMPTTMVRGQRVEVSLVVDATAAGKPEAALPRLRGAVVTGTTKISRFMSAELEGAAFKIEPGEPEQKLVTEAGPVQWRWVVTPMEEGEEQPLVLNLYAHVEEEDGELSLPVAIKSFQDYFKVDVTLWDRISDGVGVIEPLYGFAAGTAGSGWALILWLRRRPWRAVSAARPTARTRKRKTRQAAGGLSNP
jgi:hypothetical protein